MGAVAGLGGLALGVFLLLFRQLLGKLIFPTLPPNDSVRIILRFMTYCLVVTVLGMLVWLASLWAPDHGGQGKGGKPPKQDKPADDGSASVKELISLLDARFKEVVADIDQKKASDKEGRYKGVNDADALEKQLTTLHGEIKESLQEKQFVKAHELTDEFQQALESFYIYPLTLTQGKRYKTSPEPGRDPDYDNLVRAIKEVREASKKRYPGPKVEAFLSAYPKGKKSTSIRGQRGDWGQFSLGARKYHVASFVRQVHYLLAIRPPIRCTATPALRGTNTEYLVVSSFLGFSLPAFRQR
jgi:hypothetical protein